jgi:hypothetical protein
MGTKLQAKERAATYHVASAVQLAHVTMARRSLRRRAEAAKRMPMTPDDDARLRFAIAHRRLVRFTLRGRPRIAEPHDYGVIDGDERLLAYQVAGETSPGKKLPGWRWVRLAEASAFEVLEATFPGGREAPSGKHAKWDRLFLRVASG